ncbi:MAG: hypothetical protein GEV11_18550 [Streptosporangiales bacterium]|nr:hypothetical protein [Streptosporangiales bacterium]
MTDQGWGDPRIGSVVDEAMKLAGVVGKAFAQSGAVGGGVPQGDVWDRAVREHDDDHVPEECRYCPVCTAIRAVRSGGPGVAEHLVDATQSVLAAVREAAAAYERSRATGRRDDPDEPIDIG